MSSIGTSPGITPQHISAPLPPVRRAQPQEAPRVQVDLSQRARAAQKDIVQDLKQDRGIEHLSTKSVLTPAGMESVLGRASKFTNHKDAMLRVGYALHNRCKPDSAFGSNHKAMIRLAGEYENLKNSGASPEQLRPVLLQMKDKVEDMHYEQAFRHMVVGQIYSPAGTHRLKLAEFIQHEIDQLSSSPSGSHGEGENIGSSIGGSGALPKKPTTSERSGEVHSRQGDIGVDAPALTTKERALGLAKRGLKLIGLVLERRDYSGMAKEFGSRLLSPVLDPLHKFSARVDDLRHRVTDPITTPIESARQRLNAWMESAALKLGTAIADEIKAAGKDIRKAILDHFDADSFKELIHHKLSTQEGADPAVFGTSWKDARKEVQDFLEATVKAIRSHLS